MVTSDKQSRRSKEYIKYKYFLFLVFKVHVVPGYARWYSTGVRVAVLLLCVVWIYCTCTIYLLLLTFLPIYQIPTRNRCDPQSLC